MSYINPSNAKGSCARNAIGGPRGSIQVSDATRRSKVLRRLLKKRAGTEPPESRGAETSNQGQGAQRYYGAMRRAADAAASGGDGGAWIVNKSRNERTSVGPRAVLGRARCGRGAEQDPVAGRSRHRPAPCRNDVQTRYFEWDSGRTRESARVGTFLPGDCEKVRMECKRSSKGRQRIISSSPRKQS